MRAVLIGVLIGILLGFGLSLSGLQPEEVPIIGRILEQEEASAHKASFPIHKALCVVGVGCKDIAPPGPKMRCHWDRRGVVVQVFDPRLGAYVEWVCRCTAIDECKWFRLRIVPDSFVPFWEQQPRRYVYDWHRACKSIVCKKEKVVHYYPRLYSEGGLP